jgi:hypothetical protein
MTRFIASNLKTYVCTHVFDESKPVLVVVHDKDGDWSFVCGAPHIDSANDYRVVGVAHLTSHDSSLNECADLLVGFEAERSAVDQNWIRTRIDSPVC